MPLISWLNFPDCLVQCFHQNHRPGSLSGLTVWSEEKLILIDLTIKDLEKIKHGYDPVASRSWSLNAMAYIDPRIMPLEKCAIFDKTWQFAAHIEKLRAPGQYITIDVCGQSIVILRDSKNILRAFFNVCKHRGHELLRGEGLKKLIVCPYHAWSYTLDQSLAGLTVWRG